MIIVCTDHMRSSFVCVPSTLIVPELYGGEDSAPCKHVNRYVVDNNGRYTRLQQLLTAEKHEHIAETPEHGTDVLYDKKQAIFRVATEISNLFTVSVLDRCYRTEQSRDNNTPPPWVPPPSAAIYVVSR